MKAPGFGMQAGRADVVRHSYLGTQRNQLIERGALGRVGVGGGQDPQRSTGSAVIAQRFNEWADAAAANERHHHVDRIGRIDLGAELPPQGRLARSIGEQRGVEHRDEWCSHRRG